MSQKGKAVEQHQKPVKKKTLAITVTIKSKSKEVQGYFIFLKCIFRILLTTEFLLTLEMYHNVPDDLHQYKN